MSTYSYKAISRSGAEISGVIKAADAGEASIKINDSIGTVTSLTEVREKSGLMTEINPPKKLKDKELSLVCKQFSIILTAGLPIVRTVELVAGQTENEKLKELLEAVAEDITEGHSLAASFALRGEELPATFIETIRAGEESGSLESAFAKLSAYFEKRGKTRDKVKSALAYPVFVLVIAAVVIAIIMIYAVPTFTDVFLELGIDLPLPTKALIGFSNFMTKYFIFIAILVVAIAVGLRVYGKSEEGAINLAEFKLKLPIIGRIELMNAASQFANTFSTMLSAGMPVTRSLSVTGNSMTNAFLGQSVKHVTEGIEAGHSVGDCLRRENTMPDLLVEMTAVGESSGSLENTLGVIAEYYDNEVDVATTRAVSLLEPSIIVVLAIFVFWILLAVYVPMFSMYSSI